MSLNIDRGKANPMRSPGQPAVLGSSVCWGAPPAEWPESWQRHPVWWHCAVLGRGASSSQASTALCFTSD